MSDERQLLQRIRQQLDSEVEAQSPALQGRLRAARREALAGRRRRAARYWIPALAASLFAVVATTSLWLQHEGAGRDSEVLLQAASEVDMQMLNSGDEIELYQELEFYYWMQQELTDAG